jgi:hypothetical protein
MPAVDPQVTASNLLRVFHHDEPYLFLGAAFTTVAILAAAFAFLRRKVDSLAIYFAGQRLWVQAGLLETLIPLPSYSSACARASTFWSPFLRFCFSMQPDSFIVGAKFLATSSESFWARLPSQPLLSGLRIRIT